MSLIRITIEYQLYDVQEISKALKTQTVVENAAKGQPKESRNAKWNQRQ